MSILFLRDLMFPMVIEGRGATRSLASCRTTVAAPNVIKKVHRMIKH